MRTRCNITTLKSALTLRPAMVLAAALFAVVAFSANADDDPPSRVARLAVIRGDVELAPAGENQWAQASLNRPMVVGDKLMTERGARTAVQFGGAEMRLDADSSFNFLNLNDQTAQVELASGVINLSVRHLDQGQTYEVDTPTLAFVAAEPGVYRLEVAPDGQSTTVVTLRGSGTVYGDNNAKFDLRPGQSYRFNDTGLRNITGGPLPQNTDFDEWCRARDDSATRSVAIQYASPDIVGIDDLDDNGQWQSESDYGDVWFPTTVDAGWAPYRYGHWGWIDPWGWTWIDDASWGYAPFHYGRWVNIEDRWGWLPGPRYGRPVYSPALVGFVGGPGVGVSIGISVGWFPLGPRDVYCPPYRASRGYFNQVNVTNVRNINVTNITNVYNNYRSTNGTIANTRYTYQNQPGAVTAVSRETFSQARPVGNARMHVDEAELAHAGALSRAGVAPSMASLVSGHGRRGDLPPPNQVFQRTVVARTAPAPVQPSFVQRQVAITRNGGQPLSVAQMQAAPSNLAMQPNVRLASTNAQASRPTAPAINAQPRYGQTAPTINTEQNVQRYNAPSPADNQAPRQYGTRPQAELAPQAPVQTQTQAAPRPQPQIQPGALPSARFSPQSRQSPMSSQERSVEHYGTPATSNGSDTPRQIYPRPQQAAPTPLVQTQQAPQRQQAPQPMQQQAPHVEAPPPVSQPRYVPPQFERQQPERQMQVPAPQQPPPRPQSFTPQPRAEPAMPAPQIQRAPAQEFRPPPPQAQPQQAPRPAPPPPPPPQSRPRLLEPREQNHPN